MNAPRHTVVVDLGYGDAGKGAVVDRLCARRPDTGAEPVRTVVRFNGGAQAAHNVVTPDGRHHTFAQFGSGTLNSDARTHLSRFVLVDPLALAAEAAHLARLGVARPLDRLTVDEDALLTTPYHRAANRAREAARGADRHGSCGMGIGETAAYALEHPDAPRVGDCRSPARLRRRLAAVRDRYRERFPERLPHLPPVDDCAAAFQAFAASVRIVDGAHLARELRAGPAVFEGAQGVLLDEWAGFHPYTTWSTTTFAGAETLLAEAGAEALRLGVLRTYGTRHGPGPFVPEDPSLKIPEPHNGTGRWQGAFRRGHADDVALRYALDVCGGVDALALTHLDTAAATPELMRCTAYDIDGVRTDRLPAPSGHDLAAQERLTRNLLRARPILEPLGDPVAAAERHAPVVLTGHGRTHMDLRTRAPAAVPG